MNPPESQALHEHSRLASCLQSLGIGKKRHSANNLVEDLAELINLSDASRLSEQLRGLSRMPFTAQAPLGKNTQLDKKATVEEIKAYFIQERSHLITTLMHKSTPSADNRLVTPEAPEHFEPLKRFYTLQQNEMDQQIHKLRLHVRETMKGVSPAMQQLAILDALLADTVAKASRKALATLPHLLQKRFVTLQQEADGYTQFIHDMQSLLLAELETRLLPLIGLVEALDEEIKKPL